MIILLARLTLNVLANAFGLFMATILVDGFSISGVAFAIAVAIFSLSTAILGPLIIKIALNNASFLMGGIALVTTFVSLLVTSVFSDGIEISGLSAWAFSTVVVWFFSIIGSVLLPLVLFKKTLEKHDK
jgi:low temperature requirement protein LtrA